MARIAVLALPAMLGDIIDDAGKRIPQATTRRFASAKELLQGITRDDFDATIIANPDMPAAELIAALHGKNARLLVVVVNGHSVPADRSLVHVLKLDSNTADEAIQFVVNSCGGK